MVYRKCFHSLLLKPERAANSSRGITCSVNCNRIRRMSMAYIKLQTARQTFKQLKRVALQGFRRTIQVFFELKKEIVHTCSHSYTNLLTQLGSPQADQRVRLL